MNYQLVMYMVVYFEFWVNSEFENLETKAIITSE